MGEITVIKPDRPWPQLEEQALPPCFYGAFPEEPRMYLSRQCSHKGKHAFDQGADVMTVLEPIYCISFWPGLLSALSVCSSYITSGHTVVCAQQSGVKER